jgi:rhamnosyltransferase
LRHAPRPSDSADSGPAPRASIILPTCEGEADLRRLLPALAAQQLDGGFEIVAVDSASRDGSAALLREAGARLEVIERAAFAHGATRNRAAARARGEFLVFLSQDALPQGAGFLTALLEPFSDPEVAGVTARILPAPGGDPLAARTVLDLPEASAEARRRALGPHGGLWKLAASARAELLRFNNVASAIRASAFRELPLPPVSFGEDFAWAALALTRGHALVHAPAAVAHHAHEYGLGGAFERYRMDAAFHRAAHGWRVRPSLVSALRGWAYEVRRDLAHLGRSGWPPAALARSPLLRAAQVLGQYAGARGLGAPPARAGMYF